MLEKESGQPIQGMPLGHGLSATSPYTVEASDSVIEFTSGSSVTVTFEDGSVAFGDVLVGGRYAIVKGTVIIESTGSFNIG